MKGCLRVVRDNEVKLTLPGPSVTIKSDGTVWVSGNPILGITDPEVKARVAADLRAKRYERVPADAWCKMGANANGVTLMDDTAWEISEAKTLQDAETARKAEIERRTVRIYLSSRGWGDYSPVEWVGDITRPDGEILAECRDRLAKSYDVDKPNQTDEELLTLIHAARETWEGKPARDAARRAAEEEDIRRKVDSGYCFACESWCHGDCGHYSNDPMVRVDRYARHATREAQYGINEG